MCKEGISRQDKDFFSIQYQWNQLLKESDNDNIFLTWEWVYTWWEVFGGESELFIITVKNDKGDLIGIAPLHIKKTNPGDISMGFDNSKAVDPAGIPFELAYYCLNVFS